MELNMLYVMIGMYIFSVLAAVGLVIYIFPFRGLIWNRWKLKMKGIRNPGIAPVFIAYPNNVIIELVVDTSKETFTYDGATYNIRPNKFYKLFGFQYAIYLHNNPEPQDLHVGTDLVYFTLEGGKTMQVPVETLFKNPDGKYIAGKVIDGQTYDNLLIRAYNAGMAWMARNSNLVNILIWVCIGLVVIAIGVTWWKSGQTQQVCVAMFQNISASIKASQVTTL